MPFARLHRRPCARVLYRKVEPMWQTLRLVGQAIRQKWVLRKGPEQILALQQNRLRSLVAYAKAHSPSYAERLRAIDPERFGLQQLPTLTARTCATAKFTKSSSPGSCRR